MGRMVGSGSSCGVCAGESSTGIGESSVAFREPRDTLSNKKPVDLGEFLDQRPVHYSFKGGRARYAPRGPFESEYQAPNYGGSRLYSSDIRPNRNPGLYRQSSAYVRGFSEVSGPEPEVSDRPYVNFFRHNLDNPN